MLGEVPGHGLVSLAAEGVVLPGLHRDLGPQRVHHRGGPLHVPDTGHRGCYFTSLLILFDIAPAGPGGSCGDHEDGGHQESLHPRHGARTRACSLTLTGHPSQGLAHGMQSLVVTPRSNQFICGDHQHFLLLCSESRGWLSRGGVTQCHETPGL